MISEKSKVICQIFFERNVNNPLRNKYFFSLRIAKGEIVVYNISKKRKEIVYA